MVNKNDTFCTQHLIKYLASRLRNINTTSRDCRDHEKIASFENYDTMSSSDIKEVQYVDEEFWMNITRKECTYRHLISDFQVDKYIFFDFI
jgi:CO dehydrogenase/acetyl-CoA synthase gamma subunit (corrinoid Fe-S protein)